MQNKRIIFSLAIVFLVAITTYYTVSFGAENTDRIFITISTFFFSIFTGFFISRQDTRYTKLREIISSFDGKLSGVYRAAENVSEKTQARVGEIIRAHYVRMLEKKQWDYHFVNKSETISSIHNVLEEEIGSEKVESLRNQAIGRMLVNLSDCQVLRKNMIMLYQERMPAFQWFLVLFFFVMLILSVSVVPSVGDMLGSLLKAAFVVALAAVIIILRNLEDFHLFEGFLGESSAQDVVDIIDSKK